ncbi:MAG: alpha-amylase family glycosyl hydrolase [Coriobacteriales bacterium]|nr:alpha-amylase family glycosyl hydrolase [Coriobacteriales bacterium]
MGPKWLKDAVFYEIYPQSFQDSNDDGIGDLQGIIRRLDYVSELGCNALWINPCFDSPFMDAGYDVRDYKQVAPRYGTNGDLIQLFEEAHRRGIHVLLDLVPGHTSDQHPWFKESAKADPNEYSARYVWTDEALWGMEGRPYIAGMTERSGAYMLNFFASQPALNYGWLHVTKHWMSAMDSPEALATREAIKDVMRFWLDAGCDGFRVDMADSLVKNDDERKSGTAAIWRDIRAMMDDEYPNAALVSEWSNPVLALCDAGFHMDFYLDHQCNGYNTLLRDYETEGGDHSYFRCDAGGDIKRFLQDYLPKYEQSRESGYISFITCNHDTPRPARTLSAAELKLAYAFILTMPGVPFIYYGDEIGMRYLDLRTKEGGYQRTGTRTPMQWENSVNKGFSNAPSDQLYLPVDESDDAPCVEEQLVDADSLLSETRRLVALRHAYEDLQADAPFAVVNDDEVEAPFVYRRGGMVLAVNPSSAEKRFEGDELLGKELVYQIGAARVTDGCLTMPGQSFAVLA